MGKRSHILHRLSAFRRDEQGTALMEFAMMLPLMLLTFAVIIEGGRMMWSYQAAVSGIRDAARYLARTVPQDICTTGGSVTGYTSRLETIVRDRITGEAIFPSGLSVTAVTPSMSCRPGTYRISPVPVVEVTADLTITFPFADILTFNGGTRPSVRTSISDQSRVFGT